MSSLGFVKYTSFGNNFVIVDETDQVRLTEKEKSAFAYQATNINFGVGSDNFLVVQPCTSNTLEDINRARAYWDKCPESTQADFIFRMFEPDGVEALCCANGLLCIADFLNRYHGCETARIMTEIPRQKPKTITVGTQPDRSGNWVNIGHPQRMPAELADLSRSARQAECIDLMEDIEITFRQYDLAPFSSTRTLKLSGFLVFTGEPHLVVCVQSGLSLPELGKLLFINHQDDSAAGHVSEKRAAFGSWLIQHIGMTLNTKYQHLFPAGINVNFVLQDDARGVLHYRCFERGICRETLSCGTGALAVAFVWSKSGMDEGRKVVLWPYRCRCEDPAAQIVIRETNFGWTLSGQPQLLFEGRFWQRSAQRTLEPAASVCAPLSASRSAVDRLLPNLAEGH